MNYFQDLAHKIRTNQPLPVAIGFVLQTFTVFQRLGMWWRLRGRRVRVEGRVISFGNITAGGVGKTPAVIRRAQEEIARGHQVAVITRGYGARPVKKILVLAPGQEKQDSVEWFGDEAVLIARRVPGVWIVRSADRVKGAREALRNGCDTLLLDDGFQAVALERDENILMIDGANPFGNGHLIPRGILREPLHALARASEILLTRCDQVDDENCASILERIRRYNGLAPVRKTMHQPEALRRLCDNAPLPLSFLDNKPVQALCGIGNPEAFLRTLDDLGARREETCIFADHEPLDPKRFSTELPVIMTEKDAVRLVAPEGDNLYCLTITLADWD